MTLSVLTFDSLDSTNEEARRWLQSHTGNVVIRARHQTAGKGTQGRRWVSPEGAGLYFSIAQAFSEDQVVPITPLLTIAAGVACVKALKSLTQLEIQLKPINDLYLEGCKLGGILVESLVNGGRCSGLITGIGINILRREEIIASCEQEGRGNQPISLQDCIPPLQFSQWTPEQICEELMTQITKQVLVEYQNLFKGENSALLREYERHKLPEVPLPPELAAYSTF